MWRIGQIKNYHDQKAHIDIFDILSNETTKRFVISELYRKQNFPNLNSLICYKLIGPSLRKLELLDYTFVDLNFNELSYETMAYINEFHLDLIDGKFHKLLFEKERLLRKLKEKLSINDIEIDKAEFESDFTVEAIFSEYNNVGDDYYANMRFILQNSNFNSSDLEKLKSESYDNWTILNYRTCGFVDLEYINETKNRNYSDQIIEILNKVKTSYRTKFYVVDKWRFSEKCKYLNSQINYELGKNGYDKTLASLSLIIESYVKDVNEYFEFDRKLINMSNVTAQISSNSR